MQSSFSTAPTTNRQFTVRYLFLVTLSIALAVVPLTYLGGEAWPLTLWLLAVGCALLHARYRIFGGLILIALFAFMLLPPIQAPRDPCLRAGCQNNIRQLGHAILNYEAATGHFPPPFVADENGKPMHSWRVLILPYIDEQGLYDLYDFSKPWNHPNNLKLADKMPSAFTCPCDALPYSDRTTTYVAIVGETTLWPPTGTRFIQDVTDGISNTLMLVESESARTHWMAPQDLGYDEVVPVTSMGGTMLLETQHTGVAVGVFVDGHTHCLNSACQAEKLKGVMTVNGNETVDEDSL